jgi:hypothetical protein
MAIQQIDKPLIFYKNIYPISGIVEINQHGHGCPPDIVSLYTHPQ